MGTYECLPLNLGGFTKGHLESRGWSTAGLMWLVEDQNSYSRELTSAAVWTIFWRSDQPELKKLGDYFENEDSGTDSPFLF